MPRSFGWVPDLPDLRDFGIEERLVTRYLSLLPMQEDEDSIGGVDLRSDEEGSYFADAQDQGDLAASAAFAVLDLVEYFDRRLLGENRHGSRNFLHVVSQRMSTQGLGQSSQRDGPAIRPSMAGIRATLKAITRIGVPPSSHWHHAQEPDSDAFLYSMAHPRNDLIYFKLDPIESIGEMTWRLVRSFLSAGFPIVFGFSVPNSVGSDPEIPFRPQFDGVLGGLVALAVGFSDDHFGSNQPGLLFRCSWGPDWGEDGYGWLPVTFIKRHLAQNFWTCLSTTWFEPYTINRVGLAGAELYRPSVLSHSGF